jgi:hypothetical protein
MRPDPTAEARHHQALSSLASMLRRCCRAQSSHVHTRRPACMEADQVKGIALGATVPHVAHTGSPAAA